ncbi:MAG: sigma-54-dependent Fis family transcriptional regulator [Bacteroidetes bacterium]|nr:sigma-54-dependent Fis family transcriptional regulator [Bacteroidota bacterium]
MPRVLIIEDDATFSRILAGFLQKKNLQVLSCRNGASGLEAFRKQSWDTVLLDYRLPDSNGLELLTQMKQIRRETPVIVMTSFNDVRTAVKAIQLGAFEYILKPVNHEELSVVLNKALGSSPSDAVANPLSPPLSGQYIEGLSGLSNELSAKISLVAPVELTVIIRGESGTGKEYVARMIHQKSKRAAGRFVAIDCGTLSKDLAASELFGHVKGAFTGALSDVAGRFEMANRGTLFLDEIGNLGLDVQVKLLRAIQEKVIQRLGSGSDIRTDVRIIAATNENLRERVRDGSFREDLFYRLNEFEILVPPLRDRGEDLEHFVKFFIDVANRELSRNVLVVDPEVMTAFRKYRWPGNLRELRNVVRRAVLVTEGSTVTLKTIPSEMTGQETINTEIHEPSGQPLGLWQQNDAQERELIQKTLLQAGNNKAKAARLLQIDRKTLYLKLKKHNLE